MRSRPTRALLDVLAFCANLWLWLTVYDSFLHAGLWSVLDRALGEPTTLPGQLAVLGTCLLVGWLSIAAIGWLIWWSAIRRRDSHRLPAARVWSYRG